MFEKSATGGIDTNDQELEVNMWPESDPNLKKHVICEEWWIAESDLKVETSDNENSGLSVASNALDLLKPSIIHAPSILSNEHFNPESSINMLLNKPKNLQGLEKSNENKHDVASAGSKRAKRWRRVKKNEYSRGSVLKALRHFINPTEKVQISHRERLRKDSDKGEKKKKNVDKSRERTKRYGVILNRRVEERIGLNGNNGRSQNKLSTAPPILSSKAQSQASGRNPFSPDFRHCGTSSSTLHLSLGNCSTHHEASQDASSSFGLLESTQFNNSSASLNHQECSFHPTSCAPLTASNFSGMRTYDIRPASDDRRWDRDFWGFEKESNLSETFRHPNGYDVLMEYNPMNKYRKSQKALCSCATGSPINLDSYPPPSCDCCQSVGEGRRPNRLPFYPDRKDSISELVSRLLESMGKSDRGSCCRIRSISKECLGNKRSILLPKCCDCRCGHASPSCSPNVQACLQNSGIRVIPLKQNNCRRMESRCCSCHNHCRKKRQVCHFSQLPMRRITCGRSHPNSRFECCTCTGFCNGRRQQFWRKPMTCGNEKCIHGMAREKSNSSKCSRFKTITPCCSKCLEKMMLNY